MTIYCKLCNCAITNLGALQGKEPEQVMELMARHLVARHKNKAVELKQEVDTLYLLLGSYLMTTRYVRIPPSETVLIKAMEDGTQALMNLFNPDPKPVA